MKESRIGAGGEYQVGQKVAVLEHRGCVSSVGTISEITKNTNIPVVRCESCQRIVIIDHRHPLSPKK